MMNPFMYGCVVEGEFFCPRPKMEKELRTYAERGQNVVIQGERRMGKTSLVRRAIGTMRGERLLYIDLYCIKTMSDFCERVMSGIGRVTDKMSFLKKALALAARIRPTMSIDPYTGNPAISIDARAAAEPDSLSVVMKAVERLASEGKLCVVFDEVQDILKLENSDRVLAEMRSTIQFQQKTAYFFLGSVRNEMERIFTDDRSPFFKSALPYEVGAIDEDAFTRFIVSRFRKGCRKISDAVVKEVLTFAGGVCGDVQELCDALWEVTDDGAEIVSADVERALKVIFAHERKGFESTIVALTPNQMSVLRGLAVVGTKKIFSAEFMGRVGKTSPGVIKRAMNSLEELRIVYPYLGEYRFSNPFLREWIKRGI